MSTRIAHDIVLIASEVVIDIDLRPDLKQINRKHNLAGGWVEMGRKRDTTKVNLRVIAFAPLNRYGTASKFKRCFRAGVKRL